MKPAQSNQPEPVAWMHDSHVGFNVPLYTAPPQREWQGLTDDEMLGFSDDFLSPEKSVREVFNAIEAKLKEKNS